MSNGEKPYGGRIENCVRVGSVVFGYLYNDPIERWPDGQSIRISSVVNVDVNTSTLETRNTFYDLGIKYGDDE